MYDTSINYATIFKRLRKEKGISFDTFADVSGISRSTIIRIEAGTHKPQIDTLHSLLPILGVTMEEYFCLLHDTDMASFNADFTRIFDSMFARDTEKIIIMFEALKTKPYCNTEMPTIKQALLIIEAIIAIQHYKDYEKGLALYYEALSITISSKILTASNELKCHNITKYKLSMNEYRILRGISVCFSIQGDNQKSINVCHAILLSLQSDTTSYEIQKKQLPTIYFNLSNMLIDDNQYTNALDIVNKGIDFCSKTGELKIIGYLYWNKGKSLFFLNSKESATEFFCDAFVYLKNTETKDTLKKYSELAKEKYNVSLH